jgi:signal transduction histidine kinase
MPASSSSNSVRGYRDSAAPVSLDLGQAIRDILSFYQHKFSEKNIQPEIECLRKAEITALSGEIRQILSNLIVNAVDAMNTGGKLIVKVHSSPAWTNKAVYGVHITIADSGCGMTSEQMKRLFEAFYTTKKMLELALVFSYQNKSSKSMVERSRFAAVRSPIGAERFFRFSCLTPRSLPRMQRRYLQLV